MSGNERYEGFVKPDPTVEDVDQPDEAPRLASDPDPDPEASPVSDPAPGRGDPGKDPDPVVEEPS